MSEHISPIDLAVVGVYLLMMLGVGYYIFRKSPSFEEYLLAGRTMTTPILICTLASTYYGLDVLFGTSELAYNDGVVAFFGYSELSLGIYLFAAYALSTRLRAAHFTSLPEILERHYGLGSGVMGAISSILYSIPALSLFAIGRLSEVTLGIDAPIGALLLGGIALVYTLWGGLWAVAITDTIQFILMCVTLAIAIPILLVELGGFEAVTLVAPEGYFAPFGGIPIWLMIAYAATGISILVDPGYYQRIFAARSPKQARNAMLISCGIWVAYDWLVTAGGMLARAGVAAGVIPADIHSNDALLMAVTMALPVGLTGIFLAGVLATAMSTVDSYTLVSGSNFAFDLYRPLRKPDASDAELVRLTKYGVVLSWILGFGMAFLFERLLSLWVFMATMLTSTVLVPIFVALYWKGRKTQTAGLMSCVVGLASVIIYYVGIQQLGAENEVYGTYIWTFSIGGTPVSLWQEYALFFSLPMSLVGFLVGNLFGSPFVPPVPPDLPENSE
ncbi:MAG: sodium:solute symporter family protein [Deltaproteobacteria bacterium]|nr:sodium:solute symporter family protein [Deltaproteobacteria bacterium]